MEDVCGLLEAIGMQNKGTKKFNPAIILAKVWNWLLFCSYLRWNFFPCLNVSLPKTPLRQWGFWQCLPFSWTTQRGKHCRHPIAVIGVVYTFGQSLEWGTRHLKYFVLEHIWDASYETSYEALNDYKYWNSVLYVNSLRNHVVDKEKHQSRAWWSFPKYTHDRY